MNKLNRTERAQIIRALVEGNSIRSTSRLTGAARNTITSLLVLLGTACAAYQDRTLRNLRSTRIECDEIWSFCYAKEKNVPLDRIGEFRLWRRVDLDRHRS
jgi:lambda repressor-like predicted transcriptional regulator